jgi:hypothetical protein
MIAAVRILFLPVVAKRAIALGALAAAALSVGLTILRNTDPDAQPPRAPSPPEPAKSPEE